MPSKAKLETQPSEFGSWTNRIAILIAVIGVALSGIAGYFIVSSLLQQLNTLLARLATTIRSVNF